MFIFKKIVYWYRCLYQQIFLSKLLISVIYANWGIGASLVQLFVFAAQSNINGSSLSCDSFSLKIDLTLGIVNKKCTKSIKKNMLWLGLMSCRFLIYLYKESVFSWLVFIYSFELACFSHKLNHTRMVF